MNKRSKRRAEPTGKSMSGGPSLVDRQPIHPPKRNPMALVVAVGLFLVWLGFLIWLALRSA